MERSKFYVTTPIYYVNDKPHIGHAYTTILADVLSMYHRLMGVPTFFLTGTDEHGQKVQKAAQEAGITPQEQADRTVVRFKDLWARLGITNDDFIRTTEERHTQSVQRILQDLHNRDEIYRAEYDGWYCVPDERFFTEKDLIDGKCPECHRPVERIREANYFFRMSKYQEWLIQYIQEHPQFIQPDYRRNETLGFLKKPLTDLCISRPKSRLGWGIDLPFDKDYVTYVWFDALVNYISAVGYPDRPEQFQKWWPASYHLIGKDILTTHTVYWPTMLKAMGLPMPETIFAHGWWLSGDTKMSKSLGNVVNPMEMIDRYGVDAFRYFVIAEMVLGQDASFTEDSFVRRYNADLANDLGNLLSRLLNMIGRYCGGKIPRPSANILEGVPEKELWNAVQAAVQRMESSVTGMKLNDGVAEVVTTVRAINRYFEIKQPWTLAKQADKGPINDTLYMAAESLRVASALLYPVMPGKMRILWKALGLANDNPNLTQLRTWGVVVPETPVAEIGALFPRIVPTEARPGKEKLEKKVNSDEIVKPAEPVVKPIETAPAAAAPAQAAPTPAAPAAAPGVAMIEYADFARIQLRSAKVISAEKVTGTNKLLKLDVFMGEERRQLVAGIAAHYEPEQLIGKTVVVVANMKPATIRGVESQGMILAASRGEKMRLVTVDGEISSGAVVK